jgi:hypothetical protein
MTPTQLHAIRTLGDITGNRFNVWALAGDSRAALRKELHSALLGRKATRAESGVNALCDTLCKLFSIPTETLSKYEVTIMIQGKCHEALGLPTTIDADGRRIASAL